MRYRYEISSYELDRETRKFYWADWQPIPKGLWAEAASNPFVDKSSDLICFALHKYRRVALTDTRKGDTSE